MFVNKKLIPFISSIQVHRSEDRLVRYYAAAEAMISKYITVKGRDSMEYFSDNNKLIVGSDIKKMVDSVGEIAIIDRSLFESALKNTLGYKIQSIVKPLDVKLQEQLISGINAFVDILGVHTFYSKIVIDTINADIKGYSTTLIITLAVTNDLLESVL
jgi:hypothetical protein